MDPEKVSRDTSPARRPGGFVRRRLSPGGDFGLHLTLGLLVALFGGWAFSAIAQEVGPNRALEFFDRSATEWVQHFATPALTNAAYVVSYFGSVVVLTTFSIVTALLLLTYRQWERLLGLALTMLGGSSLNILLKHFFQRQRPVWEDPLVTLESFSFPSAHAMGSTLFYGFIALLLVHYCRSWGRRIIIAAVAVLVVLAISATRIYLGAHYLSDVLAAFAAGAAWLAFCWSITETLRRRRRAAARQAAKGSNSHSPPQA
jgi:membrane-associated phospholipid phosphatase